MGFDITFHPVGKADLDRYIFDVAETPRLAGERARELAGNEEDFKMIMEFYYQEFPGWLRDVPREENGGAPAFAATFVRAAAALAGFKYPYWYCRGSALTFVAEEESRFRALFTPLGQLTNGVLSRIGDSSNGLIAENYSTSGFIGNLEALRKELNRSSTVIDEVFDDEGRWALDNALGYAKEHGLGLIEAADIYVPMEGGGSKYENLRARFIENENEKQP
jgi:hypothetical protein